MSMRYRYEEVKAVEERGGGRERTVNDLKVGGK